MEHELIKDVSIKALIQSATATELKSEEFWSRLEDMAWALVGGSANIAQPFRKTTLLEYVKHAPYVSWFLKDKGFIRERELEVFYHIGQRFKYHGMECILAQTDRGLVNLIALDGLDVGNRVTTPVGVFHPKKITQTELERLIKDATLIA
jgi:hypothetical protein